MKHSMRERHSRLKHSHRERPGWEWKAGHRTGENAAPFCRDPAGSLTYGWHPASFPYLSPRALSRAQCSLTASICREKTASATASVFPPQLRLSPGPGQAGRAPSLTTDDEDVGLPGRHVLRWDQAQIALCIVELQHSLRAF